MTNIQLVDYIKKMKSEGRTEEQIRANLINSSWPEDEINSAISEAAVVGSAGAGSGAAPVFSGAPSPSAQVQAGPESNLMNFDEKTIATIKWGAVWNVVDAAIISVVASLAAYFWAASIASQFGAFGGLIGGAMMKSSFINVGSLINDVIWGAVGGAIGGFVLAKFYSPIMDFQAKYLGNKLNTLFKLLFWPRLVGTAVGSFIGMGMLFGMGVIGMVVYFVGALVAHFIYAKMMDKSVGQYYRSY
ncbi:MAG: hypothetical protein AAB498_02255 [Patescibacteria group bacterium]